MKSTYSLHGHEVQVFEHSFTALGIIVHPLADNFEDKLMAALEAAYAAGRRDALTEPCLQPSH